MFIKPEMQDLAALKELIPLFPIFVARMKYFYSILK